MKLVWHLVKSDLRRLRWPLAAWALAIGLNVACSAYQLTLPGRDRWQWRLAYTLSLVSFVTRWGLTVAFAAQTIQADPVRGATAFWLTRPVGAGRMFAAKLAILAMLVLAPAAVDAAVVVGFGLSGRTCLVALLEYAVTGAVVVAVAASYATVAETFGSFILRGIIILFVGSFAAAPVVALAALWGYNVGETTLSDSIALSGSCMVRFGIVLGGTGFVGWQYGKRHVRFGLLIAILATALLMALPSFWRWDLFGGPGQVGVQSALMLKSRNLQPSKASRGRVVYFGEATVSLSPDGTFLEPMIVRGDAELRWPDGRYQVVRGAPSHVMNLDNGVIPLEPLQQSLAPLRVLNAPRQDSLPLSLFTVDGATGQRLMEEPAGLRVEVSAERYRYLVESELPLAEGAAAQGGPSAMRMIRESASDGVVRLTVTQDAFLSPLAGERGRSRAARAVSIPFAVGPPVSQTFVYVLANRSQGEALLPRRLDSVGEANFGPLCAWRCELEFAYGRLSAAPEQWLRNATLLRVQLEDLGRVNCTLKAEGVTAKL